MLWTRSLASGEESCTGGLGKLMASEGLLAGGVSRSDRPIPYEPDMVLGLRGRKEREEDGCRRGFLPFKINTSINRTVEISLI